MANLPLMLGAQVVRFAIFVSSVILIGPIISFMWRTRRHLADAMAVQLTRYPDGSRERAAQAQHLGASRARERGRRALAFLFLVWPGGSSKDAVIGQFGRMHPKLHQATAPAPRARRDERVGRSSFRQPMDRRQVAWRRAGFPAGRPTHGRRARSRDRRDHHAHNADARDDDGSDVRGLGWAQASVHRRSRLDREALNRADRAAFRHKTQPTRPSADTRGLRPLSACALRESFRRFASMES